MVYVPATTVTAPTRTRNQPDSGSTASPIPVSGRISGTVSDHGVPVAATPPATTAPAPDAAVRSPTKPPRAEAGRITAASAASAANPAAPARAASMVLTGRSVRAGHR